MMKIIGIKTNDGYYITDNIENKDYFSSKLKSVKINGEDLKPTFKTDWFKISNKPRVITQLISQPSTNQRYELIDKSLSDKFKLIYNQDEVFDEDGDFITSFNDIKGLYEFKQDSVKPKTETVEFDFEEILQIEEIKEPDRFNYTRSGEWKHQYYPNVTENNIKYDFIGEIITPEILKHTLPCKLSKKETYDIIRKHIQENIDPKVAKITSDYDFCFTVEKNILLAKEHVYQVDINNPLFQKRKGKPKYETRMQKTNSAIVFEMSHKTYQNYTIITPFEGDDQEDLKHNIDNYLSHIISVINEPLKYCSCCNGTGVELIKNI